MCQCDHWLLWYPSLWCLHCMGLYTGPSGKVGLPNSTFFQLYGQPLSRTIMVSHIKGLLTRLGLNPSLHSRHSLHIGGATMAATARLRDLEIKSMGCWKSNTYWTYIGEMMDMKVNCVRMACAPPSNAFNYSHPYPAKDKF